MTRSYKGKHPKVEDGWTKVVIDEDWLLFHRQDLAKQQLVVKVCAVDAAESKANYDLRWAGDKFVFPPGGESDFDWMVSYRDELLDKVEEICKSLSVKDTAAPIRCGNANPEVWDPQGVLGEADGVLWRIARYKKSKPSAPTYKIYAPTGAPNKGQYTLVHDTVTGAFKNSAKGQDLKLMKDHRPSLLQLIRERFEEDVEPVVDDDFAEFIGG